jgi:hypothetical protein
VDQKRALFNPLRAPGNQHAAAGGGDDLIAVKRVDPYIPECSGRSSLIRRTHRFGGVFDHGNAILAADGKHRVHIGALAIQVDHHQRFGQAVYRRALAQGAPQNLRVHIPCGAVAIHKDRHAALVRDGISRRDEGKRGTENFIARADSHQTQCQMQRGRPAGQGYCRQPHQRRELPLEGCEVRADCREPICGEGVAHVALFGAAHMRN